eukprot:COSAG06_NODE_20443_length_795_cov_5.066092_1_plen_26_part_10
MNGIAYVKKGVSAAPKRNGRPRRLAP